METSPGEVPLQTVDRALQLLQLFTQARPEWSVTELAAAMGISKSMVHRLALTLQGRGFLSHDPETRRYRLGLSLLTLGQVVYDTFDLRRIVHPFLRELAAGTSGVAFLTVVEGDESVTLDQVLQQQYPIRFSLTRGSRAPLHASASSLSLMAFLPLERVQEYLRKPLRGFTPATITDPAVLMQRLEAIRARGYDMSSGELTPGLTAVGAPIFGPVNRLVGAVGFSAVDQYFTPESAPRLIARVMDVARQVSARLGAR